MAIFGDWDFRKELSEVETDQRKQLCQSIGQILPRSEIPRDASGRVNLALAPTLADRLNDDKQLKAIAARKDVPFLGIDEYGNQRVRFTEQNVLNRGGTALLVAEDIIATAAHVIFPWLREGKAITDFCVIFGNWRARPYTPVIDDNLYDVKEVIFKTVDYHLGTEYLWRGFDDLAFLRLNRAVAGREPIQFQSNPVSLQRSISAWMAGHPGSLPLKYETGDTRAINSDADKFATFPMVLDLFPGNSGGPVLDAANKVIGICVSVYSDVENSSKGYTVDDDGWIITIHRSKDPPDDLLGFAWRTDRAYWMMAPDAYMKINIEFHGEGQEGQAAKLTLVGGGQTLKYDLKADAYEVEVNGSALLTGLSSGLLDLKTMSLSLDTGKDYEGVVQELFKMTVNVSAFAGSRFIQAVVFESAGVAKPLNNKEVYTFTIQSELANMERMKIPVENPSV